MKSTCIHNSHAYSFIWISCTHTRRTQRRIAPGGRKASRQARTHLFRTTLTCFIDPLHVSLICRDIHWPSFNWTDFHSYSLMASSDFQRFMLVLGNCFLWWSFPTSPGHLLDVHCMFNVVLNRCSSLSVDVRLIVDGCCWCPVMFVSIILMTCSCCCSN